MKLKAAFIATVTFLSFSLCAQTKTIVPGNDATREAALITLETQLRPLIAEEHSALKFERDENSIVISGPDFQTRISAEYDVVFVRPELSGDNFKSRYNFALMQENLRFKDEPMDVPLELWTYEAAESLSGPSPFHGSIPRNVYDLRFTMRTRYEFAVALARLKEKLADPNVDKLTFRDFNLKEVLKHDPIRKDNFEALLYEFAPDLARIGVSYDRSKNRYAGTHKYQYFQVSVSDPNHSHVKLTEEIKKNIADFAAVYLKQNTQSEM